MPLEQAHNRPTVVFEDRVTRGIANEVFAAFHAVPRRGAEAGGILLGSRSEERILVEDFEPVLSEYRYGPSYTLSDDDFLGLEESVQWFRTSVAGSLQVLGFYRSQTRQEPSIDDRDNELMRRFFPEPGSLFLLLKPSRPQNIISELFVFTGQRLHAELSESSEAASVEPPLPAAGGEIPVIAPGLTPEQVPMAPEIRRGGRDEPGEEPLLPAVGGEFPVITPSLTPEHVPMAPPIRRRLRDEPDEPAGRNWLWVAAVAALTIFAAILGFRSGGREHPGIPPTISRTSSKSEMSVSDPRSAPRGDAVQRAAEISAQPAASREMEGGIREAIGQWQRAVLSGDPNLMAACYSSQQAVRRAAVESVARYGKPAILRISDLTLIPLSDSRAVASFRTHWQTSGYKVYAGEEQDRLTFVRDPEGWKIASEEETRIYWIQRPRG